MKKVLLAVGLLLSGISFLQAQDCSDLFISEYVEGWGNNKALEIYNPTNQAIDLSQYMVQRFSNGAQFIDMEHSVQLSGTLAAHDVIVVVIDKRDPNGTGQEAPIWEELENKGDVFLCPDYNVSSAMYFNGNDAVALVKGTLSDVSNTDLIDLIGKIGENPETTVGSVVYEGWTDTAPYIGVGVELTVDHSLIRKSGIKQGVKVNPAQFNTLAEWDTISPVIPVLDSAGNIQYNSNGNVVVEGNWASLGNHICDCGNAAISNQSMVNLTIYPNPSSDGTINFESQFEVIDVKVYNAVGKMVYTAQNNKGIQQIKLENKTGVYIVNVRLSNNMVSTKRIIIK